MPAPTAIVFEVPGQRFASVAGLHVVFEAAAAVLALLVIGRPVLPLDTATLNVTVSVTAAALVGSPIGEVVVDSDTVSLQQSVVSSPCARQQ